MNHTLPDSKFWAWGCDSRDVNAELRQAIGRYQQRFGRRPVLVFCGQDVSLSPVEGLLIEPTRLVPESVFYFMLPGDLVRAENGAGGGVVKEIVSGD